MKIIKSDYKTIKQETYQKLMEYFIEKNPEYSSISATDITQTKKISFVIQEGEVILGRIFGVIEAPFLKIEGFLIEEEARGKGVGRALLQEMEAFAIKEGCNISLLETTNSSAPIFYEKQGYSILGEIKDCPFPNETFYFMIKRLDGE